MIISPDHAALCYSSKRLVSYGTMSYVNCELEYRSSASSPMICTVLQWKSAQWQCDCARVHVLHRMKRRFYRDSSVHHSGSTAVYLVLIRLCVRLFVPTCFIGLDSYFFAVQSSVEAPSHLRLSSCGSVHTVLLCRISSAPAGSIRAIR